MAPKRRLILGSRGSRLALVQADYVKKLIESECGDIEVKIKAIKTTGDKVQKVPLTDIGGKALFVKEIEEELLAGKIDVGVHSMKDVPFELPPGCLIASILKREDPRDVFVSKKYDSLLHLPKKARVGTGSLRRQAQLKNFRPDLEVVPLRGNIETRLKKMTTNRLDAVILAAAGLSRLGLANRIAEYLPPSLMLPAPGQGAIGLEVRADDAVTRRLVELFRDIETTECVTAERTFLGALAGDCKVPIAAYAEIQGSTMKLTGLVASPDGRELIRDRVEGGIREPKQLGDQLAKSLMGQGAREILRLVHEKKG